MPAAADKGGEPGTFGVLNLPTEVVSSEYLTMEGKQFSSSRGHVIHMRDVLERYGPDPIRYFICAAGPENQDSNFTWAEFVQRNNSELVAGWGNLVNRTGAMIAKNFGEIPEPGALEPVDEAVRAATLAAFDTVGDLLAKQRIKAAVNEAMRAVGDVNKYVTDTEPFKLKGDDQRERLATVLHTLIQCVSDLNTILAPFLPHASNRVHAFIGGEGEFMPDAGHRGRERSRRGRQGPQLPDHHRRLQRHAAVGVAPGDGRCSDRQAHRASSSSSMSPSSTRSSRGSSSRDRPSSTSSTSTSLDARGPGPARPAAHRGRRQPHPPRHRA